MSKMCGCLLLRHYITILIILNLSCLVSGIQCYQCSTSNDPVGSDSCGAYGKFDKDRHVSVECTSDESHTPGIFCVTVIKQGPREFIRESKVSNNWFDQYHLSSTYIYSILIVIYYVNYILLFLISANGRWRNVIRRCGLVSDTGSTSWCMAYATGELNWMEAIAKNVIVRKITVMYRKFEYKQPVNISCIYVHLL